MQYYKLVNKSLYLASIQTSLATFLQKKQQIRQPFLLLLETFGDLDMLFWLKGLLCSYLIWLWLLMWHL